MIEMLWSTSGYLPSHDNGRKYQSTAQELQELMKDRLSRNSPIPVLTMTEPVKIKGKMEKGLPCGAFFDRFSQQEMIGAFEIHLVTLGIQGCSLAVQGASGHVGFGDDG